MWWRGWLRANQFCRVRQVGGVKGESKSTSMVAGKIQKKCHGGAGGARGGGNRL